jgi:hypothetical protein
LSIAPAKTTQKTVMARLDRAIQGQAHQAFVARPLDCPIKSGNDDRNKKAILRFRVSSQPKRQNRASQRCCLRLVYRSTGQPWACPGHPRLAVTQVSPSGSAFLNEAR